MSFKDMAREFMHHVPLAKFHPVLLTCLKEYDSMRLSYSFRQGRSTGWNLASGTWCMNSRAMSLKLMSKTG